MLQHFFNNHYILLGAKRNCCERQSMKYIVILLSSNFSINLSFEKFKKETFVNFFLYLKNNNLKFNKKFESK